MGDAVKKSVDGWIQRLDELLHDKDFWLAAQMDQLERKTGLKRVHLALGKLVRI